MSRWAFISLIELSVLFPITLFFQSSRSLSIGLSIVLPVFLVLAIPYALIWRVTLANPNNAMALSLAVLVATAVVVLIAYAAYYVFAVISPLVFIVWSPGFALLAVFGFSQVRMAHAALSQMMNGRGIFGTFLHGWIGVMLFGVVFLIAAVFAFANADVQMKRTSYSDSKAQGHLHRLYKCLWITAGEDAQRGFPATEEELRNMGPDCWHATVAPGSDSAGTYYEFRYEPAAPSADGKIRGFALSTLARGTERGDDSFRLDHNGVLRRSYTGWATNADRTEYDANFPMSALLGLLDAYYARFNIYPQRLVIAPYGEKVETGAMPLPHNTYLSATSVEEIAANGSIIVRLNNGPGPYLVYLPENKDAPRRYTAWYRAHRDHIGDLRSYYVDEDGAIHVTGEDRDARPSDPVLSSAEFAQLRSRNREWAVEFIAHYTE